MGSLAAIGPCLAQDWYFRNVLCIVHYKCLNSGISGASKVYGHASQRTLQGCEGVSIQIYDTTEPDRRREEHDLRRKTWKSFERVQSAKGIRITAKQ